MGIRSGDYSKAHLYHWLQIDGADRASGILESEKPAFENRIWYRYPGSTGGQLQEHRLLSQANHHRPPHRRRQGGFTTQAIRRAYNALGNPTQIIDPLGRETIIEYASNAIDVVAVKQRVGGSLQTIQSFTYDSGYPPTVPRP